MGTSVGRIKVEAIARAERRLVTVLFADVSGFTALCEKLDAEDVALTMNRVFIELTDVIEAHGGVVDKYLGDAVMALFGAPRAFGDDAERAARAGLAMIETLDRLAVELEPTLGRRLAMRIGINTGLVVAGMLGGRGYERYTVMGDTVNLASRMESASAPGRLLASGNTLRFLAGRFAVEERGLIQVKGKSEPVRAAFVLREERSGLESRTHVVEGVAIPFVGRVALQRDLVARARAAIGATRAEGIVVHGPSGVGKTRLLEHVARELESGGLRVLIAQDRTGTSEPLSGLVETLSRAFSQAVESPEALLAAMSFEADDPIGLHVAALAHRILARDRSSPVERSTAIWGLAELLAALSRKEPLVIVVEDARHGDRAFSDLLEALSSRGAPIVVFFDVETTAGGRAVVERLTLLENVAEVEVVPLEPEAVREAVRELLATVVLEDSDLVERCVSLSEGFPFFAVEYIRTLFALGVLAVNAADGRWVLVRERLASEVLPATVQLALQAEIDHLPPVARSYVQTACIGDGSFWRRVVVEILGRLGFGREEIEQAERDLVRLGVVQEIGPGELAFRSGRFHRAAYEGQLVRTRREAHRRVAQVLERMPEMASRPMAIAEQFLASEVPGSAVPHLLEAFGASIVRYDLEGGKLARDRFEELVQASPEAAAAVDRALWLARSAELAHMTGSLDDSIALASRVEELRFEAATREEAATFMRARCIALAAGARATLLRGDFDVCRAWCQRAYAASLEAGAHAEGEAMVLDALVSLANVAHKQKRYEEALEFIENGRARASQLEPWSDSVALVMARYEDTEGLVRLAQKEFASALRCFESSHRLRIGRGNPILMSVSKGNAAIAHHGLGRTGEAIRAFEEVLALRRTLGDPGRIAITLLNLAELTLLVGEHVAAKSYLEEVAGIIERLDLREYRKVHAELAASLAAAIAAS
jgi:class 3 adenylate cyclase/tetratricopeptide (TPR) repeat protein